MQTINPGNPIEPTPSAYGYPLLIKQLLHTRWRSARSRRSSTAISSATATAPSGSASASLPVPCASRRVAGRHGGVMDWDSHRYLESSSPCR
jgi:fatty-acyl-CoA synthase